MLRTTKEFEQYAIAASDGVCGQVRDFYFDDESWVIRHLVVSLGVDGDGRRVLISPRAIAAADWTMKTFRVTSTQAQVRRCAGVETATTLEHSAGGGDPLLRSANTVGHYYVHANDGDIGHVGGFLVDDHSWAIRYLLVDTSNWWLGHEVIIAPEWIEDVDWTECIVSVDLSRKAVKDSPAYASERTLERAQELCTHRHYGRDGYWPRTASPPPGSSPPAR
jgi:hypothetical protein